MTGEPRQRTAIRAASAEIVKRAEAKLNSINAGEPAEIVHPYRMSATTPGTGLHGKALGLAPGAVAYWQYGRRCLSFADVRSRVVGSFDCNRDGGSTRVRFHAVDSTVRMGLSHKQTVESNQR